MVDLRRQREHMAGVMDDARELIKKRLDYPPLLDRIDDHEDLVAAGVNSGEMIRVALGCEEYLGRPLSDTELASMTSVRAIAEVLAGTAGT
jgi:acyl carrier protein